MDQPLTRTDGTPPRILVVDDESTLAELLAMAFSYQSWEPRTAGTVQEALTAAREADFDAAVRTGSSRSATSWSTWERER